MMDERTEKQPPAPNANSLRYVSWRRTQYPAWISYDLRFVAFGSDQGGQEYEYQGVGPHWWPTYREVHGIWAQPEAGEEYWTATGTPLPDCDATQVEHLPHQFTLPQIVRSMLGARQISGALWCTVCKCWVTPWDDVASCNHIRCEKCHGVKWDGIDECECEDDGEAPP